MRCEYKACPSQSVLGSNYCKAHEPVTRAIPSSVSVCNDEEFAILPISDMPKGGRFNADAIKVVHALRQLPEGKALKIKTSSFGKTCFITAKRYALESDMRIGIRQFGPHTWLWKLSLVEINQVMAKGDRIRKGRAKNQKKQP